MYYRLITLLFAMLCLSLFVALVALIPSYVLSVSKTTAAGVNLAAQKDIPVPFFSGQNQAIVANLNTKLSLIEQADTKAFAVSKKVVNPILLKKPATIKITQISYEKNSQNNSQTRGKISINGTAPSREVLLSFRQALEDDAAFTAVDLPISNFIKGSDIQFYITLTPSDEK